MLFCIDEDQSILCDTLLLGIYTETYKVFIPVSHMRNISVQTAVRMRTLRTGPAHSLGRAALNGAEF